jgi:Mn-dependent DtxR family transcriptional regulator
MTLSEQNYEEIEKKVLEYLATVDMAKNRNVAKAIDVDKSLVDKAIGNLAKADKVEYLYLGTSFVKLKGK